MMKLPMTNLLMTKVRIAFLGLCLCSLSGAADDGVTYGDALTDVAQVRIGELLADPDRYVDRRIKIEGLVDDVCPMKGCWIDVLDAQSEQTIRVKVQDDVIVFPAQAKGSEVIAEGIVRKHEMTHSQTIAHLRHLAEEKGESFETSSVDGPMTFYQIEGTGAVVGGS